MIVRLLKLPVRGILIFAICFLSIFTRAHDNVTEYQIDSLIVRLSVLEQSPEKVNVLYEIATNYRKLDVQRSKEYANLALKLAQKIGYKEGEMLANNLIGEILLFYEVDFLGSTDYLNRALELALELDNRRMQRLILSTFSYFALETGDYDKSIRNYQYALQTLDKDEISAEKAIICGRIAENYIKMGDSDKAREYYNVILEQENSYHLSDSNRIIAVFLAQFYVEFEQDWDKALYYIDHARAISIQENSHVWESYSYYYSSFIRLNQGETEMSIQLGLEGLKIAEKYGLKKERIDNLTALSDAYYQAGQYYEAANYSIRLKNLQDSLNALNEESRIMHYNSLIDNQIIQQKEDRNKSQLRAKQLQSEKDQILIKAIAIGLIITFIFLFLLYRRLIKGSKLYHQLRIQKDELAKLSIVAANIEQMVMIVGNNDRIEWVNKAFEQKFGYSRVEAVGKTPLELLGGSNTDREVVKFMNRKIFDDKIAFGSTLTQYSKLKIPFLTRLHISPILSETNELERYVVISHDITAEQKVAEELRELSLIASNTTNSIAIFDKDLRTIWVNNGFTKLTGFSFENVLGKKAEEIYSDAKNTTRNSLVALYESQKPFNIEQEIFNRYANKNNWVAINVTPVFNEKGDLQKYISVATDITAVKELEAQYESLVEGSTDMIYEIDVNGNFIFVNDVMSKILGWAKEEIKRTHFLEYIQPSDKERVALFYRNQIKDRQVTSHIEFRAIKKNGDLLWVGQRARLKWDAAGERILGFRVITRDITDQKQVEVNLVKTHDNARLLSEIGMQITSTHSIPDIIDQVYGNINKLMDANIFGIAIPTKKGNELIFPHIIENGQPLANFKFDLADDYRLAVICFREGREIIIRDFDEEIRDYVGKDAPLTPIAGEQANSIIYLPLFIRGVIIGVITVQSFEKNAYDEYQLSLVKSLASFVAIAMENAGLYETMEEKIAKRTIEVHRQKEELEVNYFNTRMLSEIGQLIASTLDLNKIFDQLYDKVGLLMDAEIFAIRLYDEVNQQIHFKYTIEKGMRCEPFSISMDEVDNYNVWCIRNRKEIFLNDNRNEFKKYVSEIQVIQGEMPNSLIFYPMIVENKMIGVITIQSFKLHAYQPYHLDILKTLASYLGTTLDNAALYETLEEKVKIRTEQLEQKNLDITASINYAKRLQKGILPDKTFMRRLLTDSFVYFQPKDIVSGDFYWVERTQNRILFAVVDCTGHGVPGAMMSIIGRNLLDQAVNEKGLMLPSQILNFLQVGLSRAFGQTGDRKADLFDGMDLALCSVDLQNNLLEFAGANSSLYLIQDDELIVLNGDKIGISAEYEITHFYTNLEIEIKKGDVIYLTSDGFPDQFGGPRYKKYTYKRMEQLFSTIYKEDMEKQFELVKSEILNWKDDKDQTDDICLLGVRI